MGYLSYDAIASMRLYSPLPSTRLLVCHVAMRLVGE